MFLFPLDAMNQIQAKINKYISVRQIERLESMVEFDLENNKIKRNNKGRAFWRLCNGAMNWREGKRKCDLIERQKQNNIHISLFYLNK